MIISNTFRTLFLSGLFAVSSAVAAQQSGRFSVATLNVDGLPQKILVFNVNADGPGSAGSVRISKYLAQRGYDLMFFQEDFNYHDELTVVLEDSYQFDQWSGAVGLDVPGKKVDLLHAQNEQFECDGLGACWKNGITLGKSERVAWKQGFGKFSHANDMLVTKGFRRYELTFDDGTPVIVYNMHMDASYVLDEAELKDGKDREARLAQWQQLRDDVIAHIDTRPIIVVGDMNSYYYRDQVKAQFIDAIEATGKATVNDVFVELGMKGVYPAPQAGYQENQRDGNILNGETFDKILYINPVQGTQIKAVSYSLDTEGYKHNGKVLGDHYPLVATFEVVRHDESKPVGIGNVTADEGAATGYYNLKGQSVEQPAKGLYIENDSQQTRKVIRK